MPVSLSLFIVFGFPCSEDTDWLIITNEKKMEFSITVCWRFWEKE